MFRVRFGEEQTKFSDAELPYLFYCPLTSIGEMQCTLILEILLYESLCKMLSIFRGSNSHTAYIQYTIYRFDNHGDGFPNPAVHHISGGNRGRGVPSR